MIFMKCNWKIEGHKYERSRHELTINARLQCWTVGRKSEQSRHRKQSEFVQRGEFCCRIYLEMISIWRQDNSNAALAPRPRSVRWSRSVAVEDLEILHVVISSGFKGIFKC